MNISFVYNLVKAAKITAILSFLGGTFLLIAYFYTTGSGTVLHIGMYYALFALLLNSILFSLCMLCLRIVECIEKRFLNH